jgi:hypothetical protein
MALRLALLACTGLSSAGGRLTVPIGTLFNSKNKDLNQAISAMSFAMQEHESSNRSQEHVLKFYVDNIDTVDAYKLTKIICKQVRGRYLFSLSIFILSPREGSCPWPCRRIFGHNLPAPTRALSSCKIDLHNSSLLSCQMQNCADYTKFWEKITRTIYFA